MPQKRESKDRLTRTAKEHVKAPQSAGAWLRAFRQRPSIYPTNPYVYYSIATVFFGLFLILQVWDAPQTIVPLFEAGGGVDTVKWILFGIAAFFFLIGSVLDDARRSTVTNGVDENGWTDRDKKASDKFDGGHSHGNGSSGSWDDAGRDSGGD